MKEQKIIISISNNSEDKQTVTVTFEPGISGQDVFDSLSKEEKHLQNTACAVANYVMEALSQNRGAEEEAGT